ncbi:MAG: GTP cyclohydrolase I FolE [Wolinella sp.]
MEEGIRTIFDYIGEDRNREGLLDTPKRVVKSWEKLYSGYAQDPREILGTVFSDGACDEMVVLKNIEFYSMCEHHMLPFFGKISIGYIPSERVVGISKLARLVEVYARRLQIQEKMTAQIADTLMEVLQPKGVMVVAEAKHMCMVMRGVEKQQSIMLTSAVRGVFKRDSRTREEFMGHIR